jgi:hypothetical protein
LIETSTTTPIAIPNSKNEDGSGTACGDPFVPFVLFVVAAAVLVAGALDTSELLGDLANAPAESGNDNVATIVKIPRYARIFIVPPVYKNITKLAAHSRIP